ncbi:hypothetical protein [Niabella ginsengisoli]|uniref:AsmA-like C-terminal domain-containing protein n=1 Tax=Niabella ginsengisoli TaxID=522298 RepID=A0ABS9SR15_9BACT|nr:hypothetical protein [Niabella ginsengisoli]MCH5600559.1 hypothetical protein [Niabella ginsengisoli]
MYILTRVDNQPSKLTDISFANLTSIYDKVAGQSGSIDIIQPFQLPSSSISIPKLKLIGNLSIRHGRPMSNSSLSLYLNELEKIEGDAGIDAYLNASVIINKLNRIEGNFLYKPIGDLTPADFPALNYIGGNFDMQVDAVTSISGIGNLNYIGGNMYISGSNNLRDYCILRPLLSNGGLKGTFTATNAAYNPTAQQIIAGNCSQ